MKNFDPSEAMLPAYLPLDGTMEFFGRVRALLKPTDTVVDLGAGRGAWFYEDRCEPRRALRDIKPHVSQLVGLDIDPVVLTNPTTTRNAQIVDGKLPLPDTCADAVVADYVLEHVQDTASFFLEVDRILKPGGFFCARTPHKYHYVAVIARMVGNARHVPILGAAQPDRRAKDVFPTAYRINTLGRLRQVFSGYENFSYLYAPEPAYYFGRKTVYGVLRLVHRILPAACASNLFVFLRKPPGA